MAIEPEQVSECESLVMAMTIALNGGAPREAAQIVAAECVVNAETKDHMNCELIGRLGLELDGDQAEALKQAYAAVEDEEDHEFGPLP